MAGTPKDRRSAGSASLEGRAIEVIDRYQIVSRLGKGGMAEVFRAKLQSIGGFERDVALKVLLPSFASEPEFVEMLLDEARIAGGIDHPNVLQVLDVGRKNEIFYLVMEFIDGHDLRSIAKGIAGGQLPLGMSLFVISEVLRGLHAVHTACDERGTPRKIVHRDISPGNVMLDRRGFVKLGDFGIAHASGRITRTRVGAIKGKSRYMAPEQLAGTPVDHRADLYAVGVTLFEALLGDFARASSRPTIYGPMFTWPDHVPDELIPADVECILRRAITETPDLRYRDAAEMRADLELALRRWAPGYNTDTLAQELVRMGVEHVVSDDPDSTRRAAPPRERGVGVMPVRFRGVATAEHSAPPPTPASEHTGTARSDLTPIQGFPDFLPATFTPGSIPALPGVRTQITPSLGMAAAVEVVAPTSRQEKMLPRRVGWGLLIAALALVTVGVAAAVASTGSSTSVPTVEESHAVATVTPRAVALPRTGAIEVLGPVGADVQIAETTYGVAPLRLDLPPGDYLVKVRARKRHVIARDTHVIAGQTVVIR